MSNPVELAIEVLGNAATLARVCRQKPQAVTRWRKTGRMPAHHVMAVVEATAGKVTAEQLRPDVFKAPAVSGEARAA